MHVVRNKVVDLGIGQVAFFLAYVDQLFDIVVLVIQSQIRKPLKSRSPDMPRWRRERRIEL